MVTILTELEADGSRNCGRHPADSLGRPEASSWLIRYPLVEVEEQSG